MNSKHRDMISLRDIMSQETLADSKATDKARGVYPHIELYEVLFEEYRDSADKVFEVGVNRGGSIKVWLRYFHNATVYGLDNREVSIKRLEGLDRAVPVKIDQSNAEQLEVFATRGPFDIGIDDGSHIWSHQILTFEKLWPSIKPGGLYVIEDVITSYPRAYSKRHYGDDGSISCVEYFKKMVDDLNFNGEKETESGTEIQRTVDWLCFRSNSIFLRKRSSG